MTPNKPPPNTVIDNGVRITEIKREEVVVEDDNEFIGISHDEL